MEAEQPKLQVAPFIQLVIRWVPGVNGKMEVSFPQMDDVVILGMLEKAKEVLTQMRQQQAGKGPSLIVPARMVQ